MSEPNPPSPGQPATSAAITAHPAPGPAATPVAAKPAVKPTPKPAAKQPARRAFVSWIAIAWAALSATVGGMLLGSVRFLFPNVLSEPPSTFKAGPASSYEEGKVEDKYKEVGSWVILYRDDLNRKIIYALSTTCTHLGCTPNWLEADKKFKCPCHGSGFKITGVNFEGPAPRPLERYAIKKTDDGQLIVDKSQKFQKELGQWDDPNSYVLA